MTQYDKIVWGMILALLLALLALMAAGAEITQGAGARALVSKLKVSAAPQPRSVEVSWRYTESPFHWRSNMTFYVWRKAVRLDNVWRLVTVTDGTNTTDAFYHYEPVIWYAVAASNRLTEQVTWMPQ